MNQPLLIATLGYPGSGKTYFSERLAKEFNLFHVNADKIRFDMFDTPLYTSEEHKVVFRFIDWLTQELLSKGVSVIVDANTNRRVHRKKLYELAKKVKARYVLLYMRTPIEVAERRLIERMSVQGEKKKYYPLVNPTVFHKMKRNIEVPGKEEPVLEVNGLEPYTVQVKIFKKWLKNGPENL